MTERSESEIDAEHEADRAAQEAGAIGGSTPNDHLPEEERPVAEAGGGQAEGFEQAEEMHRENAENMDGGANPILDAPAGEAESDLSGAEYGEADEPRAQD